MGMAVETKEILFDTMQQELQIGADDVEPFVIDGMAQFLIPLIIILNHNLCSRGVVFFYLFIYLFFPVLLAVRTKMVYCKIDQTQRKVVVR